jgi:hypothetical protein
VFPLRDGVLVDLGEELGTAEFRREEIRMVDDAGGTAAPSEPGDRPRNGPPPGKN